jgi:hypothetical protein
LRVLGECLGEAYPRSGKGIDVGRTDDVIAVTADTVGPQLIGQYQHDIPAFGHRRSRC